MGGWGSGRQNGQRTIEDCGSCRLSTKSLRALLRSPAGGNMQLLYRADGAYLSLAIEVRPNAGHLRLQHPPRAESRIGRMDYTVGLVSTEVGFGGRRWWFLCPVSGRRSAVLYLPRGAYQFGSAKGYRLAHGVTRLATLDRLWHRMVKIAHRLGDNAPDPDIPPRRPKWMRQATYARLLDVWHEAAERRDDIYESKIAGFLAQGVRLDG
jgi:hypothetical protein